MNEHSGSRRVDVLQEEAPHLIADAPTTPDLTPALGAVTGAAGCLEEAVKELDRGTPNANWYAARHLEDAIAEARRALRLVNQLPQTL